MNNELELIRSAAEGYAIGDPSDILSWFSGTIAQFQDGRRKVQTILAGAIDLYDSGQIEECLRHVLAESRSLVTRIYAGSTPVAENGQPLDTNNIAFHIAIALYTELLLEREQVLLGLAIQLERDFGPTIANTLARRRLEWKESPGALKLAWTVHYDNSIAVPAFKKGVEETLNTFFAMSHKVNDLGLGRYSFTLEAGVLTILLHRKSVRSIPLRDLAMDSSPYREAMLANVAKCKGVSIPWAVDSAAELIPLTYSAECGSRLLIAQSGSGKTVLISSIVPQVCLAGYSPRDIQFIFVDGATKTDLKPLASTPYSYWRGKSFRAKPDSADELMRMMSALRDEMDRRQELINAVDGVSNWVEYNQSSFDRIPALVLFFDELPATRDELALVAKSDSPDAESCAKCLEQIDALLERIGRIGRSAGVFFFLISQEANLNKIGDARTHAKLIYGCLPSASAKSFSREASKLEPYSFYLEQEGKIIYSFNATTLFDPQTWKQFVQHMESCVGPEGIPFGEMNQRFWNDRLNVLPFPSRAECPFTEIATPQPYEPLPDLDGYVEGDAEDEFDDPWETPA